MSGRRSPRPISAALAETMRRAAPATRLAAIQAAWNDAVGDRIAAQARPVAERDGVLTVSCSSAAWAQELDLLAEQLLGRLRETAGEGSAPHSLRFRAADLST
jgi:predicted nucleic acid-binding Zn ribbon protein